MGGIELSPLPPSTIEQFFKFGQGCGHKNTQLDNDSCMYSFFSRVTDLLQPVI